MQEREFFSSEDVYVSLTRFVASGQTYAMSGVTSVTAAEVPVDRSGPILLISIGLISLLLGFAALLFNMLGIFLIGWGINNLLYTEPQYSVILTISSGQVRAVVSKDREFISKVVQALNDCIVARG